MPKFLSNVCDSNNTETERPTDYAHDAGAAVNDGHEQDDDYDDGNLGDRKAQTRD